MMNYDSFQEVMTAATHNPQSNTISLRVGDKDVVMRHSGITSAVADKFHQEVRAEYERQKSEGYQETGGEGALPGPSRREDGGADLYRGGATSTESNHKGGEESLGLKELLNGRFNRQSEVCERLEHELKVIQADLLVAIKDRSLLQVAMDAIAYDNTPEIPAQTAPEVHSDQEG